MIPHTQAFLNDPENGQRGDCWRTAVACVLDVERDLVPHVNEENVDLINGTMKEYLASQGYSLMQIPLHETSFPTLEKVLAWMEVLNPDVTYFLSGLSKRGWNHVVICRGGEVIWDPHPSRDSIEKPDNGCWHIEAITRRSV